MDVQLHRLSHYGTLPSQDKTEFPWGTLDILRMKSESLQTYLENNSNNPAEEKEVHLLCSL